MSNHQPLSENSNKFQKKYFDFSGRITGTTYFLRAFLANILSFIAGYFCGYGWVISTPILVFGAVMLFYLFGIVSLLFIKEQTRLIQKMFSYGPEQ